jgi:PST family polysaccharide transporter
LAKPGFQKAAANLGWLLAERGVRLVLGVVVGFFVARHLGPDRLGSLSYCTALVMLAGGVVSLGLDAVVKRELLQAPGRTAETLASGALLRFVAGLAGIAVLAACVVGGLLGTGEEPRLLMILGLTLLQPSLLVSDLWLQAHLQAKVTVWAQTAALAAGAALRVFLIVTDAPLAAFAWAVTAEAALVALGINLLARRTGLQFTWGSARLAGMRRLLAESWPLMFAGLAIVLYMKIDEVMLRFLAGPAAVGLYSAATRLSEIWYFIPVALASSLLPALLRSRERGAADYEVRLQHYYDLNAAVGYALSIPVALAAPWIVHAAYGAPFAASAPIVAVHIWSSVFVFIGVARGQWLVNERLQIFYLVATLAGAVANIGLNFVLIPRWGGLGAAYATVVSYAVAAWLASYFHPVARAAGAMQAKALLIPFRAWGYLRRA